MKKGKNLQRILSILLIVIFINCIFPFYLFAANENDMTNSAALKKFNMKL